MTLTSLARGGAFAYAVPMCQRPERCAAGPGPVSRPAWLQMTEEEQTMVHFRHLSLIKVERQLRAGLTWSKDRPSPCWRPC